jgi:hypothetical protein
VAGDPKVEAGERAICPSCGTEVMHHSMIPILRDGALGYVCVACARTFVAVGADSDHTGDTADGAAPPQPANPPDPGGV